MRFLVQLTFALAVLAGARAASAAPSWRDDPPVELATGWEWTAADSPDAARAPKGAEGWFPWTRDEGLPVSSNLRSVWVRVPLPAGNWRAPALFLGGVIQQFDAYVDGERIFSSPKLAAPLSPWYLVPLPAGSAGKLLALRLTSDAPDIGPYGRAAVGAPETLILGALAASAGSFVAALFAASLAFAALAIWVRRREDRFYLAFAVWAACTAGRIVSLEPSRQLLLDNTGVWQRALPLVRAIGPVALCALVDGLFARRHPIVRRAWRVAALLVALLSIALLADPSRTYPFTWRLLNFEWLAANLLVLGALIPEAVRGQREARVFMIGYAAIIVTGGHDALIGLHVLSGGLWLNYGDPFFIGAVASIVLGRLSLVHAQLQRHTSELERTNAQLRDTEGRLGEAVAARDDFLAVASHELCTPLAALQLQVEMMVRGTPATDAHAKIKRLVARMGALIEQLLDVTRARSRKLELVPAPLDAALLVREVAARLADGAARAGCQVVVEAPESLPADWDAERIDQVLTNLLGNAFKYGGGKPVALALGRDGERARLSVRDQGIGIAPEDHERIFARFERAVSARHYGGLGLGLWITREIVDAMGGSISVQSEPGRGAEFVVHLPLEPKKVV